MIFGAYGQSSVPGDRRPRLHWRMVAKRLIQAGHRVVLFDQNPRRHRLQLIMDDDEIARAVFVNGDITDPAILPAVLDQHQVDRIIHLAALQIPACRANPRLGALVNVVGFINVFESAAKSHGQVKGIALRKFDLVIEEFKSERPHEVLGMKCPAEIYATSAPTLRRHSGAHYPFHAWAVRALLPPSAEACHRQAIRRWRCPPRLAT